MRGMKGNVSGTSNTFFNSKIVFFSPINLNGSADDGAALVSNLPQRSHILTPQTKW